jgi:tRNA nucleotidyltransferase (CCA-adding enzyme)
VVHVFGEIESLEASLRRMEELGLLRTLHPRLSFEGNDAGRLARVLEQIARLHQKGLELPTLDLWQLTLMSVAWRLEPVEREELADRLGLAGDEREALLGFRERLAIAESDLSGSRVLPHLAARSLAGLEPEEQALLAALGSDEVKTWVERWLEELRHIELTIAGRDLLARGATPGPAIGAVLAATLDARLDGVIGADEELSYATELLEKGD